MRSILPRHFRRASDLCSSFKYGTISSICVTQFIFGLEQRRHVQPDPFMPRSSPRVRRKRGDTRVDASYKPLTDAESYQQQVYASINDTSLTFLAQRGQDVTNVNLRKSVEGLSMELTKNVLQYTTGGADPRVAVSPAKSMLSLDVLYDLSHHLLNAKNFAKRIAGTRLQLALASHGHIPAILDKVYQWHTSEQGHSTTLQTRSIRKDLEGLKQYLRSMPDKLSDLDTIDIMRLVGLAERRMSNAVEAYKYLDSAWQLAEAREFDAVQPTPQERHLGRSPGVKTLNFTRPIWSDLYDLHAETLRGQMHKQHQRNSGLVQDLLTKMENVLIVGIRFDEASAQLRMANLQLLKHELSDAYAQPHSGYRLTDAVDGDAALSARSVARSGTWIHHMTKAALSGLPEAAHELGQYYENFSHYPSPTSTQMREAADDAPATMSSDLWLSMAQRFGISGTSGGLTPDSTSSLDPAQAMGLARHWYTNAAQSYFAPSCLALLRMQLSRAPSPSSTHGNITSNPSKDHANTSTIDELARTCIGASKAQSYLAQAAVDDAAKGEQSRNSAVPKNNDFSLTKWRLMSTVFETWAHRDSPYFLDMTAATATLCKQMKRDVYAEDGSLLYRYER